MQKVVKYGAIGLGIVASLFLVALLVLVSVVDLNDYKERIAEAVHDATGRTVTFSGDLKLLVFPRFGVELGALSLSNAKGFGPEPMVSAASASVTVKTIPLLLGDIRFGDLVLDGLVLNMGRNTDGVGNWDDLVGRPEPSETKELTEKEPFSLEVGGVDVSNASVVWDDRMTNTKVALHGLKATTGKIASGSVFPVDLSLDFECSKPDVRGTMKLTGKSSIDFAAREYGHLDMNLTVAAKGADIPGGAVDATVGLKFMALDFNKEHAQVSGLTVSAYGATVHLDGSLEGITRGVKSAKGTLSVDPFNVKTTLASLGAVVPETADSGALTRIGGNSEFSFAPGVISMKNLQADVDGTRVVGEAKVERGNHAPSWFARLDVGKLDLDRYLPPNHAEATTAAKEQAAAGERDDMLLPVEFLRHLDADVEARISELVIEKARLEKVSATLKAKNGLVVASPVSAAAYGGTINGGTIVRAEGTTVQTEVSLKADKVDIGGLSRDMTGESSYEGIATCQANLESHGVRRHDMLRTMNGTFEFHLADGVFPGVNLTKMARETHQDEDRKGKVESSESDSTRFGSISGSGTVKDGIVHNEDLAVKAPGLRADGHGAMSLTTRKIDFMVKAKLVPQAKGQGGKDSDDLFGVMVPIHVTGTIDDPHYWVSVTEYVKSLGGLVVGTVGSVLGGVTSVVKGVGSALGGSDSEKPAEKKEPKRSKFLGIF